MFSFFSKVFFASVFFIVMVQFVYAQTVKDSARTKKAIAVDSSYIKHPPKKAALYSLVPGGGQIYNKKYWKVGIIYAGMGALTYGVIYNQKYYQKYNNALDLRFDSDTTTFDEYPQATDGQLIELRDYFRRNRDLCYIGLSLVYIAQVIDAYVDAHLFYFNVSDDVTLNWSPTIDFADNGRRAIPKVNLCFTF